MIELSGAFSPFHMYNLDSFDTYSMYLMTYTGTDAELAAQAANHDATLRAIKEEKVVSLRRVNDETDILNQAERKRSACLTELGTVLAQKDVSSTCLILLPDQTFDC